MDDDIRDLQDAVRVLLREELPPKHGWNTLDNYLELHRIRPQQTGFVLRNQLRWTDPFGLPGFPNLFIMRCNGLLICRRSVRIKVEKIALVEAHPGRRRRRVRTFRYAYHAYYRGGQPILRVDNFHFWKEHHQHRFDPITGEEFSNTPCDWPVLHEFVQQVRDLVERN